MSFESKPHYCKTYVSRSVFIMRNQCKCKLPYVNLKSIDTCERCGNQNGVFALMIAGNKPFDKAKKIEKDKVFIGDIFSVYQKPFGCYVEVVEVYNDGWCKVQVPNGGYMDTQILGELIKCSKCTDKNGQNIGNFYNCERCGRSVN